MEMKRNRKVELVFRNKDTERAFSEGGEECLGYPLDPGEVEKLTADQLRAALIAGWVFIVRRPNGKYIAIQGGLDADGSIRPGEIKERADGSYKIVRVEEKETI